MSKKNSIKFYKLKVQKNHFFKINKRKASNLKETHNKSYRILFQKITHNNHLKIMILQ